MENKLSVSIILPIKSSKAKDFEEYFNKAITSINSQQIGVEELVIVHTNEESLISFLNSYDFGDLEVNKILWDKNPNYSEQVNFGIKNAKGKWVSLFEFDDEYSSIWFKNVVKYIESYPEVQMFFGNCFHRLPIDKPSSFEGRLRIGDFLGILLVKHG